MLLLPVGCLSLGWCVTCWAGNWGLIWRLMVYSLGQKAGLISPARLKALGRMGRTTRPRKSEPVGPICQCDQK